MMTVIELKLRAVVPVYTLVVIVVLHDDDWSCSQPSQAIVSIPMKVQ
jgi:hypothetical protein